MRSYTKKNRIGSIFFCIIHRSLEVKKLKITDYNESLFFIDILKNATIKFVLALLKKPTLKKEASSPFIAKYLS